ncbi:MAG: hypothetical protein PHY93_18905 [Bacteriovorax sp.]|nr:hypothetical protein [Bacteriovorax sp.]
MKKMKIFFLLFSLQLLAKPANADILFINLNNAIGEIETAKASASARGEKLIIVPNIEKNRSLQLKKIQKEIENLKEINKKLENKKSLSSLEEKTLRKNYEKLSDIPGRVADILDGIAPIEQLIQEAFIAEKKDSKIFSSIILSGHHTIDNANYGIIAKIDDSEFAKILNDNQDISSQIKSLYLWGCYTTAKNQIYFWKKNLPSAQFIAGFEDRGPSDGKAINHDMLKNLMQKEKILSPNDLTADAVKKVLELISSIDNVKMSSAALYYCGQYVNTSFKVEDISNPNCELNIARSISSNYNSVVIPYLTGQKDVPESTDMSPLRAIYSEGQKLRHCADIDGPEFQKKYISLLELIFFKQVSENFFNFYKNDLNAIIDNIKAATIPKNLMPPRSSDSRPNILAWIKRVSDFAKDPKNTTHPNFDLINRMNNRLQNVLLNLNCMRPDWIEDYGPDRLKDSLDEKCAEKQN